MTSNEIFEQIKLKKSFLCVGLDSEIEKIPSHLLSFDDPVFEFNKQIIDATLPYTVAYKPNAAFYEARGTKGWISLEKTINYLNEAAPNVLTIADAKRGDIGNTSKMYAKAFFENMNFDAITVAPYMGIDSVSPFMEYDGKHVILLALTSNQGASDFQLSRQNLGDGLDILGIKTSFRKRLYERVLQKAETWGTPDNMMFVIGATKADYFITVRSYVPNHFLLVPGVGAQGGSLQEVARNGMNSKCGLLVNSSRAIIFASKGIDFADAAAAEAKKVQQEMEALLIEKKLL